MKAKAENTQSQPTVQLHTYIPVSGLEFPSPTYEVRQIKNGQHTINSSSHYGSPIGLSFSDCIRFAFFSLWPFINLLLIRHQTRLG
jgi:hypothetical protein